MQRLAGYTVEGGVSGGVFTCTIRLFSFTDTAIVLPGGDTIPANTDQQTITLDAAVDVSASVTDDASHVFHRVTVRGEEIQTTCTFSVEEPLNATDPTDNLVNGWTAADQTALLNAGSGDADYLTLSDEEKIERNNRARSAESLGDVFSLLQLTEYWTRKIPPPISADDGGTMTDEYWIAPEVAEIANVANGTFTSMKTTETVTAPPMQWVDKGFEESLSYRNSERSSSLPFVIFEVGTTFDDASGSDSSSSTEVPIFEFGHELAMHAGANVAEEAAESASSSSSSSGSDSSSSSSSSSAAAADALSRTWAVSLDFERVDTEVGTGPGVRLQVDGAAQWFLTGPLDWIAAAATEAADDPTHPDNAGQAVDWRTARLTATIRTDTRLQTSINIVTPAAGVPLRELIIDVPDRHLHITLPGTITDLNTDGTAIQSSGSVDRNDLLSLRDIATAAANYYGKRRRAIQATWQHTGHAGAQIGTLITSVSSHYAPAQTAFAVI